MNPKEKKYHMPAEWGQHECCWMQWPHENPNFKSYAEIPSWSHFDIEKGRLAWANAAKAISNFEKVKMIVHPINIKNAKKLLDPKVEMTDADLVQLISAYRMLEEDVELTISTRESETFRNNIVNLGITSMSAESKTNPGGYVVDKQSLDQFEISDERSTEQITQMLKAQNLEVVWKDWENNWE